MSRPLTTAVLSLLAALLVLALLFVRFVSVPELEVPTLSGTLRSASLEHDGRVRTWTSYVPFERAEHPALVFVLHGSMSDGVGARSGTYYGFDRLADRFGFVVAYPDGFERHWNGCRAAGPYAANELNIDDVGFLEKVVDRMAQEFGVDPTRVFATGISNGGQMSLRLALEAPRSVRGVAPVAASMPDAANLGCAPAGEPVALLLLNGTKDPMNPYEGGTVAFHGIWGKRGTVLSSEATAAYWAELAGHTEAPVIDRFADVAKHDDSWVERTLWKNGNGPEVALYAVHGGGHTFPHPRFRYPRLLGPTNADIDAAAEIWAFFARQFEP